MNNVRDSGRNTAHLRFEWSYFSFYWLKSVTSLFLLVERSHVSESERVSTISSITLIPTVYKPENI